MLPCRTGHVLAIYSNLRNTLGGLPADFILMTPLLMQSDGGRGEIPKQHSRASWISSCPSGVAGEEGGPCPKVGGSFGVSTTPTVGPGPTCGCPTTYSVMTTSSPGPEGERAPIWWARADAVPAVDGADQGRPGHRLRVPGRRPSRPGRRGARARSSGAVPQAVGHAARPDGRRGRSVGCFGCGGDGRTGRPARVVPQRCDRVQWRRVRRRRPRPAPQVGRRVRRVRLDVHVYLAREPPPPHSGHRSGVARRSYPQAGQRLRSC